MRVRSSSIFAVAILLTVAICLTLGALLYFGIENYNNKVNSASEFKEEAINGRIFHYNNGRVVVDKDHNIIEVVIQP
jgi:archaellum component FlaF (FlaF/FlaG flagellin family)